MVLALAGVIAIVAGVFSILIAFGDKVPKNPFLDFIGESLLRQRARYLVVGIGCCLLGLTMVVLGISKM